MPGTSSRRSVLDSKRHFLNKRFLQLSQQATESMGARDRSEMGDLDFARLEEIVRKMQTDYASVVENTNKLLRPKSLRQSVLKFAEVIDRHEIDKTRLGKLGQSMVQSGQDIGEESTLGAAFVLCGNTERQLSEAWLQFEQQSGKRFVEPMTVYAQTHLKELQQQLKKLEADRLYVDANKQKAESARRGLGIKSNVVDVSVLKHREAKVDRLRSEHLTKCDAARAQLEHFFYDMEDDQFLVLMSFIEEQMKFFQNGLDILSKLAGQLQAITQQPVTSITGTERAAPASIRRARVLYDYSANSDDELSLAAGEILSISSDAQGDWLEATNQDGMTGLVPSNYVELLADAEAADVGVSDSSRAQVDGQQSGQSRIAAPGLQQGSQGMAPSRSPTSAQHSTNMPRSATQSQTPQQASLQIPNTGHTDVTRSRSNTDTRAQEASAIVTTACDSMLRNLGDTQASIAAVDQTAPINPHPVEVVVGNRDALMQYAQELVARCKAFKAAGIDAMSQPDVFSQSSAQCDRTLTLLGESAARLAQSLGSASDRSRLLSRSQALITTIAALVQAIRLGAETAAGSGHVTDLTEFVREPAKQLVQSIGALLDAIDNIAIAPTPQPSGSEALSSLNEAERALHAMALDVKRDTEAMQSLTAPSSAAALAAAAAAASLSVDRNKPKAFEAKVTFELLGGAGELGTCVTQLISAAIEAQRAIGPCAMSQPYFAVGVWSEGLVSAAREVAEYTSMLRAAAEGLSNGTRPLMDLPASARAVAAATMQLVLAGSTRNPNQAVQLRLHDAGAAVRHVCDKLSAAQLQQTISQMPADSAPAMSASSLAAQRAAELEARSKVLQMERNLEKAREDLHSVHKAKYVGSTTLPRAETPPSAADQDLMDRLARLRQQ
ncbi:hypothetical protein CAOG_08154 [Capsaspora owczarzaki ATCC 30864]|uniref:SH3 domain-containing protein n=1 Tax=Capsaspora owczarzaki (strain ATCC 30864) TaxID=595528 RepID=A0A0D2W1H3_CAPO3|nr:hypothetical protein CAOG_08154 [Capsaspora owczarzaki ATCC 30864]KJE98142.1 hypothetical protein CAOG_008154 [Capsaspora owczarzaki ATCC 30864]|eukprot:XP_004342755.1 hypothetical protein CAOG_08154 [Capsaspora owczarzaki ATCC 30864]